MNNITTLENVFQRVDAMTQTCHDSLIPVKDISFDNLDTIKIAGSTHPLKPIAQRSIAWRLGIPYNYLRKCPPEIQSVQMNYWIEHEKNEQLFARFDGNSVRAIFTPKYKPINQLDLILEILVDRNGSIAHCVAEGIDRAVAQKVEKLIYISEYKRFQSAPGPRLTKGAFWLDRRYPIVNRWRDPS